MKHKFKFIDLFSGLGGFHHALARLGGKCVFAAEKDKVLNELYKKNYPDVDSCSVAFDITQIDFKAIPQHDVLCAGFPCQPFSKAGKRKGFNDPMNGNLFNSILDVIDNQAIFPNYLILENVPNILTVQNGKFWNYITSSLNKRNYEVSWRILSPEDFGIPQGRKRVYLVASQVGLESFNWPEHENKDLDISNFLEENPLESKKLSDVKEHALELWSYFLNKIPISESITFPIWADEFGANYNFENSHPALLRNNLESDLKGSLGKPLVGVNGDYIRDNLPVYVRDGRKNIQSWKKNYIRKNRQLYLNNKSWIDNWKNELEYLPISLRKFEWNCSGETRILDDKIIQFRPSGIRVKKKNSIPTLVAMNVTQTPYFPWLGRYMTVREGLALQGLDHIDYLSSSYGQNLKAIGNAVNSEVILKISNNLLSEYEYES